MTSSSFVFIAVLVAFVVLEFFVLIMDVDAMGLRVDFMGSGFMGLRVDMDFMGLCIDLYCFGLCMFFIRRFARHGGR